MRETLPLLEQIPFPPIRRGRLDTLQLNVGYRCNQTCVHCHVDASPHRTEEMGADIADLALAFLERRRIPTLDITGGAPELNPHFRSLVTRAKKLGVHVMDRCNLTILEEQEDLAAFLARERVEVVASMPCYLEENVDRQRGKGAFDASIRGLKQLNAQGYGREDSGLTLNLVYNPQGPSLPPPQAALAEHAPESYSTTCSRSPTCRSDASARCWRSRAGSPVISISCAARTPTPISPASCAAI